MVFRPQISWGWKIAICLFLEGTGAGTILVSLLLAYIGAPSEVAGASAIVGTLVLLVAALFLMADLGRGWDASSMLVARRMALLPNWASWVLRGSVALAVTLVFGIGYSASFVIARYIPPIPLGALGGFFALAVILYAGFLLASSKSTPFWNSAALPVLFLFSGLVLGVALVYLVSMAVLTGEALTEALAQLQIVIVPLIVLELITLAAYLEEASRGREAVRESLRMLTWGTLAPLFWCAVVVVGLVVPLVVLASPLSASPIASALSALFLLFGGAYLRYLIIRAGVRLLPLPSTGRPVSIAGWTQVRR